MEIIVSKGELFRGDGGTGGGGRLHQLLLGALRTQDVGAVCDEALAHQGAFAHGTDEAVVVPVPVLEGDEAGATNACKWSCFLEILRFELGVLVLSFSVHYLFGTKKLAQSKKNADY